MSWDINSCILIGRLTKDPEIRYTPNGDAVSNISLAVNGLKEDDVSFFNVEVWGKQAENLNKYVSKGKQICVEGFLKQDRWEKDGKKFSSIKIRASRVQYLDNSKKIDSGQKISDSSSYQEYNYDEANSINNIDGDDPIPY